MLNYSVLLQDVLFAKNWALNLINMSDDQAGKVIKIYSKYITLGIVPEDDKNGLDDYSKKFLERMIRATDKKSERRYSRLLKYGCVAPAQNIENAERREEE